MTDRVFDHLILVDRHTAVVQVLLFEPPDCLSEEEVEYDQECEDED
jgi:hypothetical protein